ncbi:MAG: sensor histidine kinase [Bacteroidota bacterium]
MIKLLSSITKKPWFLYASGSLLFLLLPIFSSPDFAWDFEFLSVKPFQRSFISYCLLLLFFYIHMFWLLPDFYFAKRYWLYSVCLIGVFLLCAFLPSIIISKEVALPSFQNRHAHFPGGPPGSHHSGFRIYFLLSQHLFQFIVVAIFSYTIKIYAQWKRAERAIIDAELAYLKAQINPHFLFNTLNSIYALAIQKSDATADSIVQLSNMMRYVLTDAAQNFVPLSKEIDYIRDYIALQTTRLPDNVVFGFQVLGAPTNQQIAPMLLVPLIENAFKYGVNPDEECCIDIITEISEQQFIFMVKNKKVSIRIEETSSNKMGIENVRKRLMAVYPSCSSLIINDDEHVFMITLKISFL